MSYNTLYFPRSVGARGEKTLTKLEAWNTNVQRDRITQNLLETVIHENLGRFQQTNRYYHDIIFRVLQVQADWYLD